jgi:hypothetical protein
MLTGCPRMPGELILIGIIVLFIGIVVSVATKTRQQEV